jgi:hypothetical protein
MRQMDAAMARFDVFLLPTRGQQPRHYQSHRASGGVSVLRGATKWHTINPKLGESGDRVIGDLHRRSPDRKIADAYFSIVAFLM